MEAPQDGFTVILLTHPGAPARQLRVPRAWPVFLGVFGVLSVCGSLLVGRQARALCEAEPELTREPVEAVAWAPREQPLFVSTLGGTLGAVGVRAPSRPLREAAPLAPAPRAAPLTTRALPAHEGPEAGAPLPLLSGRALPLFDVNSGHAITVTPFDRDGVPDTGAFAQLRSFMRCRRSGHEMDMDPRLIAVLSRISQHFGDATLQIISGHRKADGKTTRETSQHTLGTAADIRIAGVPIEAIKAAAHALGAKGVGLYTKSQFVHVDVRERAYAWQDKGDEADEAETASVGSAQKAPVEAVAGAPVVVGAVGAGL